MHTTRFHCGLLAMAILTLSMGSLGAETAPDWTPAYGKLLEKYVSKGGVKYADWHRNAADLKALKDVVDGIAAAEVPKERDAALAFYLNAYNAWVLHNILAKYPTKGPLDGETFFFHGKRIKVAGKKMSLDTLEQKIIRPTFEEPRVHFALNCAALSCPPLGDEPFVAAKLDRQLDGLTKAFCKTEGAAEVDRKSGKLRVSKIFDWYKEDFEAGGGVIAFVNQYGGRKFSPGLAVEPMDYDWSLNETR